MLNYPRKNHHFLLIVMGVLLITILSFCYTYADDGQGDDTIVEYDVVADFQADNNGDTDASAAINDALFKAAELHDGQTLIVKVPAGVYRLDHNLFIYSNTKLQLDDGAIMISANPELADPKSAGHQGSMIKSTHLRPNTPAPERCHKEDTNHLNNDSYICALCNPGQTDPVVGYGLIENVEISGGKWNANGGPDADTTAILIRHGSNITLKNTEIYNFTNHAVNISGCQNVTVNNVTFKDAQKYDFDPENKSFWPRPSYNEDQKRERYRWLEALHFDFCSAEAESGAWPKDNTPPKNITVTNCTFHKVYSGIGTHHNNNLRASNILIDSCVFSELINGPQEDEHGWPAMYKSVDIFEMKNCGTDASPVENVNELVYLDDSTGISIHDNVVSNTYRHGICVERSAGEVYGNTLLSIEKNGVLANNGSNLTIKNNTINGVSERGVVIVDGSSSSEISSNTIINSKFDGILINKNSVATITGNDIQNAGKNATGETANAMAAIKVLDNSTATITDNTNISEPKNGIVINGSTVIASNNIITAPEVNGITFVSAKADSSVKENIINNPVQNGIYLATAPQGMVVSKNTINSPKKRGIVLAETSGLTEISENKIANSTEDGILVTKNSVATITNNEIQNAGKNATGETANAMAAIKVLEGSNATITNNTKISTPKNGIVVNGSKVAISNNTVTNPAVNGVTVVAATKDSSVKENTIDSPGQNGVFVAAAPQGMVVSKNTINSPKKRGIVLDDNSGLTEISGNKINNSTEDGILINKNSVATIKNNEIENAGKNATGESANAMAAIKVLDNSTATITSNTKISTPKNGISVNGSKVTATNNTITNPAVNGVTVVAAKKDSSVKENTIDNPGQNGIFLATAPQGMVVSKNTINSPKKRGIVLDDNSGLTEISGNKINDSTEDSVLITNNSAATIKNNEIQNAGKNATGEFADAMAAIKVMGNSTATITGNAKISSSRNGIWVNGAKASISNNAITSPKRFGIFVDKSKVTSSKNIITNPGSSGIYMSNPLTGTQVLENEVTGAKDRGIMVLDSLTAVVDVKNNKITDAVNDGIFAINSTVHIEGNTTVNSPKSAKQDEKDIRLLNAKNGSTLKNNKYGTRGFLVKDSIATGGGNTSIYAKVTGLTNKPYTGSAITQNPVVKIVDSAHSVNITARKGTDYSISYKNNVNAGTATVVFKDPAPQNFQAGVVYYPIETTATFNITGSGHVHSLTKTAAKAATCTTDGNKEYWTCTSCKKVFSDSAGKTETTVAKMIIAKSGHKYGAWIKLDATQHQRVCANNKAHVEKVKHTWDAGKVTKQPTTAQAGVKTFTCTVCKAIRTESIPKLKQVALRRISGGNRYKTSQAIAEAYMKETKQTKLNSIIVASGTTFPDALAGGYLAKAKNAPIVIWHEQLNKDVQTFIKQKVKPGGTIYILGGTIAVGESIKTNMGGYKFVRLADTSRYGTNLKILDAVGLNKAEVLVCDGGNDGKGINALIASATGRPLLLVDKNGLIPIQKTWLGKNKGKITKFVIIGDGMSVSTKVEGELKAYGTVTRISGKNGDEVSARVASTYYKDAKEVFTATMNDYPDGLCGGPLAVFSKGPIMLVNDKINGNTVTYAKGLANLTRVTAFGGDKAITDATVKKIAKNSNAGWTIIEK